MNIKHLKPFPAGKTAEELGIDTSKKFVVVKTYMSCGYYKEGDVLEYIEKDGMYAGTFRNSSSGKKINVCVFWHELAYAPNQKISKNPHHTHTALCLSLQVKPCPTHSQHYR